MVPLEYCIQTTYSQNTCFVQVTVTLGGLCHSSGGLVPPVEDFRPKMARAMDVVARCPFVARLWSVVDRLSGKGCRSFRHRQPLDFDL